MRPLGILSALLSMGMPLAGTVLTVDPRRDALPPIGPFRLAETALTPSRPSKLDRLHRRIARGRERQANRAYLGRYVWP